MPKREEISIYLCIFECAKSIRKFSGDNDEEAIPVPIPNTEVKLLSAEDTCGLPCWENRKSPDFIYSSLAQSVERSAVNRNVVSSSLTRGSKKRPS